jgi:hypothetical protein
MNRADVERYTREQIKDLNSDLTFKSVENMGAEQIEVWNIFLNCPRCGEVLIRAQESGDVPIPGQIRDKIQNHEATP